MRECVDNFGHVFVGNSHDCYKCSNTTSGNGTVDEDGNRLEHIIASNKPEEKRCDCPYIETKPHKAGIAGCHLSHVNEEKILCPTCGDVTNGHPAQDKICVEMLQNGFSLSEKKVEWIEKYKNHCCGGYICTQSESCDNPIHGYCGYQLDHGFDLVDVIEAYEQGMKNLLTQKSELIHEIKRFVAEEIQIDPIFSLRLLQKLSDIEQEK